jgi:preprotein translocase subunit SecG
MTLIFVILITIVCVILGFLVLIQAPKGGGLAGNVGGIGNNLMGVKETTNTLEKGTWIFVALLAILSLFSTMIIGGNSKTKASAKQEAAKSAKS